MLTGTLVTATGFLPVGFAKSSAGEYAGGIAFIGLALIASWVVAVLFAPSPGLAAARSAKSGARREPDTSTRAYRACGG